LWALFQAFYLQEHRHRRRFAEIGICRANPRENGLRSRVWAPHAEAVFVIGSFNDWAEDPAPMTREDGGTWYVDLPDAKPGQKWRSLAVPQLRMLWPRSSWLTTNVRPGEVGPADPHVVLDIRRSCSATPSAESYRPARSRCRGS
jgi:hypothetical protein